MTAAALKARKDKILNKENNMRKGITWILPSGEHSIIQNNKIIFKRPWIQAICIFIWLVLFSRFFDWFLDKLL